MTLLRGMGLSRMYSLDIKPEADKVFKRLSKKNQKQLMIIHKKLLE